MISVSDGVAKTLKKPGQIKNFRDYMQKLIFQKNERGSWGYTICLIILAVTLLTVMRELFFVYNLNNVSSDHPDLIYFLEIFLIFFLFFTSVFFVVFSDAKNMDFFDEESRIKVLFRVLSYLAIFVFFILPLLIWGLHIENTLKTVLFYMIRQRKEKKYFSNVEINENLVIFLQKKFAEFFQREKSIFCHEKFLSDPEFHRKIKKFLSLTNSWAHSNSHHFHFFRANWREEDCIEYLRKEFEIAWKKMPK